MEAIRPIGNSMAGLSFPGAVRLVAVNDGHFCPFTLSINLPTVSVKLSRLFACLF